METDPQFPRRPSTDAASLPARVQAILTSPRTEWPVIAAEDASIKGLYTRYIMILAAIPAVFGFIKGSLIGHSMLGINVSTPILMGLFGMVLGYVLGLVVLYVVAMIVNALAPSFGGRKDHVQALKAVGYAWTAAWVAGIGVVIPWLGWLIALAGAAYSIYLLYLGLPHTMKCPPEKSLGYTAVSVVITFVLSLVLGAILAGITGAGALATGALGGSSGSDVTFDEDSRLGQLERMGKRMEAAARDVEAAKASGDGDAQAKALGAMMGAMSGSTGADGEPVPALAPEALRALLPDRLGNRARTAISASRNSGMGMEISQASATYAAGDGSGEIQVEIVDLAAMGSMMAMASAFGVEESTETSDGFERTYSRDGQLFSEEWNSAGKYGTYSVTGADHFKIEASGNVDSFDELRSVVGQIKPRRD
ncbi:Yip1 family protein [Luteimonas changyuni]|uniref:Yip1 family protein n=1 Tax=Luteimonas sp. MJ145 TaxID=3129234 RepID=UPI0031BA62F1